MSLKTLYYIAATVGSIIGGWIPTIWGAGMLSATSILASAAGGIAGIVVVYKFNQR